MVRRMTDPWRDGWMNRTADELMEWMKRWMKAGGIEGLTVTVLLNRNE